MRKMEDQLQQRNISGVWESLKTVSGQRTPDSQAVGDQSWVNDMNLFFNRFDQTPTPPTVLPAAPHHLFHPLRLPPHSHLYSLFLTLLGKVSLLWKTSCVVPEPKIPHPKHFNRYRPVALTSHLMKTLERLVLVHLCPLVGHFMDPLQFAYQPGIGVDDAIIFPLDRSLSHLEKPGGTVRIIFFDFSSAFNTILTALFGGQAAAHRGEPTSNILDLRLPH
ncbi:uncharacterized protein LOC119021911 [Acanthopagrus latus]|uniref:uncharacterized protein LOC119021911 n=1 Tax=Acanthopagrus latus TaxID=8177 RepID=UPI00187BF69D|nr:uncharacterized protein LOC119021911 [Acanthopagrus latus]